MRLLISHQLTMQDGGLSHYLIIKSHYVLAANTHIHNVQKPGHAIFFTLRFFDSVNIEDNTLTSSHQL